MKAQRITELLMPLTAYILQPRVTSKSGRNKEKKGAAFCRSDIITEKAVTKKQMESMALPLFCTAVTKARSAGMDFLSSAQKASLAKRFFRQKTAQSNSEEIIPDKSSI